MGRYTVEDMERLKREGRNSYYHYIKNLAAEGRKFFDRRYRGLLRTFQWERDMLYLKFKSKSDAGQVLQELVDHYDVEGEQYGAWVSIDTKELVKIITIRN